MFQVSIKFRLAQVASLTLALLKVFIPAQYSVVLISAKRQTNRHFFVLKSSEVHAIGREKCQVGGCFRNRLAECAKSEWKWEIATSRWRWPVKNNTFR